MTEAKIPRKRWTWAEYRHLTAIGILEDGKVELVNGEIWCKVDKGFPHSAAVSRLLKAIASTCDYDCLQLRSSVPLSKVSDPEPDLALLAHSLVYYLESDPGPSDVVFVAEVSDLTLCADLTIKCCLYGSAGIPAYWVVDIPNRLLHVFRSPNETGYAEETILNTDEQVYPLAAPEKAVRVADLLP